MSKYKHGKYHKGFFFFSVYEMISSNAMKIHSIWEWSRNTLIHDINRHPPQNIDISLSVAFFVPWLVSVSDVLMRAYVCVCLVFFLFILSSCVNSAFVFHYPVWAGVSILLDQQCNMAYWNWHRFLINFNRFSSIQRKVYSIRA